jgi:hypothetical protein
MMMGQYRFAGNPKMQRLANMSTSVTSQGQMQGMMYEIRDYEDCRSPRYTQQYSPRPPSTISTVGSVNREQADAATANAAVSYQGRLSDEQKTSLLQSISR